MGGLKRAPCARDVSITCHNYLLCAHCIHGLRFGLVITSRDLKVLTAVLMLYYLLILQ